MVLDLKLKMMIWMTWYALFALLWEKEKKNFFI